MRKRMLKIGIDADDVLYKCNQRAVELLAEEYHYPPASIYEITSWGASGTYLDERIKYFTRPDFVENQPLYEGAQNFIRQLSRRGEVFFVTAVGADCMAARAKRLRDDFPEVPEKNIVITSRKDIVDVDVLLDDGAHNITGTRATYPVLFRRPWNNHMTGLLSVNCFEDFIDLVDQINGSGADDLPDLSAGGILSLVGPTGSGKNTLAAQLLKDGRFARPQTTTTRPRRPGEPDNYHYISKEEFEQKLSEHYFLETTVYGGYYYGTKRSDIEQLLREGKIVLMPIDICGAISIRKNYPSCSAALFLSISKAAALQSILSMDCSDGEKILRILSLDAEFKNENLCDLTVRTDEHSPADVCRLLSLPVKDDGAASAAE